MYGVHCTTYSLYSVRRSLNDVLLCTMYMYIIRYIFILHCTNVHCTNVHCTNVYFTMYSLHPISDKIWMYSVHCTLYIVKCTLVHYTLYKCTLFTVQVYTVHCTLYTMNNVVYTIMCNNVHGVYIKTIIISNTVICTLQYTLSTIKSFIYIYSVHFTYSLYNIQCTLYIAHFIMYSVHCTVYSV